MILRPFFVVLSVGQYKHCMHFPKFLHRKSNMDTQIYNIDCVMFVGPNSVALYIRYLIILTLCF